MGSKAAQQIGLCASSRFGPPSAKVMQPTALNWPLASAAQEEVLGQTASRPCAAPKRRRVSSELAGSSATWHGPNAKKPRIQSNHFPGAHVEVWHKDPDLTPTTGSSGGPDIYLQPSARNIGVSLMSSEMPVLQGSLDAVHDPFKFATNFQGSEWPLSSANGILEWQSIQAVPRTVQDLGSQPITAMEGSDLCRPNCQPAPCLTPQHVDPYLILSAAATGMIMPDLSTPSPKTMPSPGIWTNTAPELVPLIGRSGLAWPLLIDGFDYSNSFPPSVPSQLTSPNDFGGTGFPYYKTGAMPNSLALGSTDVYAASNERVALSSAGVEGAAEYMVPGRLPFTQEPVLNSVPIFQEAGTMDTLWPDALPPTNRIMPWRTSHQIQPPPHNGLDQCVFNNDWVENPSSCTLSQQAEPRNAVVEQEEVLRAEEDSRGPKESCTGHTSTHKDSCPASGSGVQSRVMVSYKTAKPVAETTKRPRKPRTRPDKVTMALTSITRDAGACIRCKIQRRRCLPDLADPTAPCQPCSRVAKNPSRKVIHRITCHRFKLEEVVLFRTSASNVTNRWHGDEVRNVPTSGRRVTVRMMQDFVSHPFVFDVSFVTRTRKDGYHDKTTREWYDGAVVVSEPVSNYALADVQQATTKYKDYIRDSVLGVNCRPSIEKMAAGFRDPAHDTGVVGDIYTKAWEHFCALPRSNDTWNFFYQRQIASTAVQNSRSVSDTTFLLGLFQLQFALRHATGWSWLLDIDGGIPDAAHIWRFPPLRGRISTPRLVVGQIDAIRISIVLKPLSKSLIRVLTTWISDKQHDHWLTIFFAVFILLVEIAKATEDAYHHGWYDKDIKGNGPKNAHFIRDLHETANVILAHWHYFHCGTDVLLFAQNQEKSRKDTPLRSLSPEQLNIAKQMWEAMHRWRERPHNNTLYGKKLNQGWWEKWCHPMYFADQMVDLEWTARPVFT